MQEVELEELRSAVAAVVAALEQAEQADGGAGEGGGAAASGIGWERARRAVERQAAETAASDDVTAGLLFLLSHEQLRTSYVSKVPATCTGTVRLARIIRGD